MLWALTDNQGTVRDVVNSDGIVVNHITYDSFGKVTGETNPAVDFRFGYTGRELDSETGLYYYRARYYNPNTGRFLSEDLIGFDGGDANLYRYVRNSPINGTDPYGERFTAPPARPPARPPVRTIPSGRGTSPIRPNSVPPGYPYPDRNPAQPTSPNTNSHPAQPEKTCVTTPGSSCTPTPSSNPGEWAEDVLEELSPTQPISCPVDEDDEDKCEKYRDFAHGSSLESINIIKANGLNNQARNNRTRGGQVNRPGFYTIELTQQDGNTVSEKLSLAYDFGKRAYRNDSDSPTAILIMQLCDDVYRKLAATGKVFTRPIAGAEQFTETVFKPESFNTLNREAKFIDTLIP